MKIKSYENFDLIFEKYGEDNCVIIFEDDYVDVSEGNEMKVKEGDVVCVCNDKGIVVIS